MERPLVKYNVTQAKPLLQKLDDAVEPSGQFNQFEGKKSTYDFDKYTTKIDEAKITPEKA